MALAWLAAIVGGPISVAAAEPPSVTMAAPSNGTVTGNQTPSFSGTTDDFLDEVVLNVYEGTTVGTPFQTVATSLPPAEGAWSLEPSAPLSDGVYTAQATQTNLFMETGRSEPPVTFTVDTSSPAVTLEAVESPSNNTRPSFAGTASDTTPVTVQIYAGSTAEGSVVSTATATGTGGTWTSGKANPALSSGQYTAVATQPSSLGNPPGSSEARTFTVDTSSPTVTLEAVESPSSNTKPSFTGSASDTTPVTVRIYAGSTAEGSVVSTATATGTGGGWTSGNASPALSSGQYTAVATQPSSLGNPPGSSEARTFTVDTSSPAVTLNPVKSPSNNTTPAFTGTASDTTAVTVQIYAGPTAKGAPVSKATASGNGGDWTSAAASPALSTGQYTAVATQPSSLGNPSGSSEARTFTVDTSSPTVTLEEVESPSNNTRPSFTGTASDTTQVTVQIYAGATAEGSVVSTATATGTGGGWTSGNASPALSSGQYTAVATQESSLGNPAGTSSPVTFVVDTSSPTVTLLPVKSPSNDTTPSFSGSASDSTAVTVQIYAGPTAKGAPVSKATAPGNGGDWTSAAASPALSSGQYTAVATQPSSLGNPSGSSEARTFTVDTSSPTVTLEAVESPSNDTTPSFSGVASDSTTVTVQIYAGPSAKGTVVATATAAGTGGAFASGKASPALSNGQYTAVATQPSSLGNPSGVSEPRTFIVDTTSPTVTLGPVKSPSNNTRPSFTGSASDTTQVTVQIYAGATAEGSVVSTATATGTGGSWTSGKASPALSSGQYTALATQPSSLGNPAGSSEARTFTVDTRPPAVTVEAVQSPSNNTQPSFAGTASDTTPVTVQIYAGATAEGSVVSTATATGTGGSWTSGKANPALSSGQYTAVATQPSSLGNPAGTSSPVTFVVDTSSPTVTLDPVKSPSNDTTPSFSGFASDSTAVTVQIYAGPTVKGAPVSKATASGNGGDWTSGAASPALSSGQYTAVATQPSSLGNPAGSSEAVTFTVETAPPRVTLEHPQSPSNNTTPSFTGTASDTTSVVVQIYAGSTAEGSVVSTATATGTGGSWTSGHASPALSSGQYTAVATQPSSLGNPAGTSSPVTFVVDTSSPAVTLNPVKSPSNNTTPSFTGSASARTQVTVQIYAGPAAEGPVVSTATATGTGGGWTSGHASPALSSGQYTAIATQPSPLGNPAGVSGPVTFTVDTAAPRVTLDSPALRSNNTAPSFTGTASDTTQVTVQIYAGTTAKGTVVATATAAGTGGAFASGKASPALSNGQYTALATQPSSLGNPSGVSEPQTFIVDTTSPTVTLDPVKSPSNNTTPSFTGSASDTTTVTVQIYAGSSAKGTVIAMATATPAGGSWTSGHASPALSSGQYTAVATQPSSLGNPAGTSSPVTFVVDTSSPAVTLNPVKSPSNNTTPAFTGTASDTTAVTVQIYSGATVKGPVVATATATGTGGAFASGTASPALSSGQYTALATQESSLGNPPGASKTVTFTVDTMSPTVTLGPVQSPSNNTAPSFGGSASDTTAVTVHIYDASNSEVSSATATPTGGKWTSSKASPGLASGKHTYTAVATQESSLGNPPGTSAGVAFTVDTNPPTVTLNAPIARSNDTTPSFSGSSSDTTPVSVSIYAGAKATGSVVATATAKPNSGSWISGNAHPALANGKHTYTAVARQESSLGNASGSSETRTFTVDTAAPTVILNAPSPRSNDPTPTFTGTSDEATDVVVHIYDDSNSEVAKATAPGIDGSWTSGEASPALADGNYRAVASQESLFGNAIAETASFSFTIDTVPPQVTLGYPADHSATSSQSQLVKGSASTAEHDLPGVTVRLYAGSSIASGQPPLQSIAVNAASGSWSATFAGLAVGTYAIRAEQSDDAGNVGVSSTVAFTVAPATAGEAPTPPSAAFSWFPAAPQTGESVTFVSNSTSGGGGITAFDWDLTGGGAFAAAGSLVSTSFSTPGQHVVRLRVTDSSGLSSVAARTVQVIPARLPLMRPFPIVRIVATYSASRAKLTLLSVQASPGAHIVVKCKGRGCPVKTLTRIAAAGKVGTAPITFRRFQRSLRAGVVLEIRVFKSGQIGKYTSLKIRRGRRPQRFDACLLPAGTTPITCPSS